jgi:probable phosphoglycerate mutase
MKKIYLVRHGESESNVLNIIQDEKPLLSPAGIKQAEVIAKRLQHLPFNNILISDTRRTRQTAEPILAHTDIVPIYTPLLRELKRPTSVIGLTKKTEIFKIYDSMAQEHSNDPAWHYEDEENFFDVLKRCKDFLNYATELVGDTLAVTHGRFTIFTMMYVLLREKFTPELWFQLKSSIYNDNTGITVLKFDDVNKHWRLETYNDKAHFAE